MIELYTRTKTGRGIRALIAESQHDPSLAEALRDRFIASRRAEAATVFERGIERGEKHTLQISCSAVPHVTCKVR